MQTLPCFGRTARDRRLRQTGSSGDIGPAVSFEVTQDEGGPVLLGQSIDFLIQDLLDFAPGHVLFRFEHRSALHAFFVPAPSRCGAGRIPGDPASHAVKPTRHRFAFPNRRRFARQHQERGLKHVLSILLMVKHAPAHAHYHGPVALDDGGEGKPASPRHVLP